MKRYTRTVPPAVEPVTLGELLAWTSITIDDVDGTPNAEALRTLEAVLAEVRNFAELAPEAMNGRCLVKSTWRLELDAEDLVQANGDQRSVIHFDRGPLVSVSSVTHTDTDGTETAVSASDYWVHTGDFGRLALRDGKCWPANPRTEGALSIVFVAGHVDAVGPILQASTDSLTLVTGSAVDVRTSQAVRYGVEVKTYGVTWAIYGADASDYSDEVALHTAEVLAGSADYWATQAAPTKDYYRVKIQSTDSGLAGAATVYGYTSDFDAAIRATIKELCEYRYQHRGAGLFAGAGGWKGETPDHFPRLLRRLAGWRLNTL